MAKGSGYSSAEVKAGLFLTLCIGLFVAMLFVYGKASRLWQDRQVLTVAFTSVTSLRPEAPVRFNGVEVGRVRDIRIINLKKENLLRLAPFRPIDLDNLPLTAPERLQLKAALPQPSTAEPADKNAYLKAFDQAVRATLGKRSRTMVELSLELLSPKDDISARTRYLEDDQIRINTTLLGDTSVEIISGTGKPVDPQKNRLALGVSGDFFTNLGKSVEQVKEILSSVSDVVGAEERQSVRAALNRFDSITEKVESIVELANKRLPATWDRVDDLAVSAKKDLEAIGDTVKELKPRISNTLQSAEDAVKDLQKRIGALADEARQAVEHVTKQIKPIMADIHYITDNSKDDFPLLIKNAKELAARLKTSADKLDGVLDTGNRLLGESYPDLRRLILALRMGSENFEEATNLIKRKPWLVLNKPAKETDFVEAQKSIRELELAMRRFRELSTELQAIRRNKDKKATKAEVDRLDFIIQELDILTATITDADKLIRKNVLPPFQRKKGGLIDAPEAREVRGP